MLYIVIMVDNTEKKIAICAVVQGEIGIAKASS